MDLHYKFVKYFHEKYGCAVGEKITDVQLMQLRMNLIAEEYKELVEASEDLNLFASEENIAHFIKELTDLHYVIIGMYISFGIPLNECMRIVHESNISKAGGKNEQGKVVKGITYKPADLTSVAKKVFHNVP